MSSETVGRGKWLRPEPSTFCVFPECGRPCRKDRELCARHFARTYNRGRKFCSWPGCKRPPRTNTLRCAYHYQGLFVASRNGGRPPKPDSYLDDGDYGWQWCEPCGSWVKDLLHTPAFPN